MTTWADFAVVAGVLLLPLAGAAESKTFWGPDRPWFLPNQVRIPLGFALLALLYAGFSYQDYLQPADVEWNLINLLNQVGTAFSRVFSLG